MTEKVINYSKLITLINDRIELINIMIKLDTGSKMQEFRCAEYKILRNFINWMDDCVEVSENG